jgi:hypothetical protein
MGYNLPDDYGMGWQVCRKHNVRWHLSDGCCDLCVNESVPETGGSRSCPPGSCFVSFDVENKTVSFSLKHTDKAELVWFGHTYAFCKDDNQWGYSYTRVRVDQEEYMRKFPNWTVFTVPSEVK